METFDGCYPGTDILINKLNIKDAALLEEKEGQLTGLIVLSLIEIEPATGNLDFNQLKRIHKEIFGDIYSWAGNERNVNISKDFMFCDNKNIPEYANEVFTKLHDSKYFQGLNKSDLAQELKTLYVDLNCLHPFREGNGRANKTFLQYVGGINGYNLQFDRIPKDYWNKASYAAAMGSDSYLKNALEDCMTKLSLEKTNFFRKACGLKLVELNNDRMELSDITKDILSIVRGNKSQEELLNKSFQYGDKTYNVINIEKIQRVNQANAIIEDCETHNLFLEKNFAGTNPFKLNLNQKVKITSFVNFSSQQNTHQQ